MKTSRSDKEQVQLSVLVSLLIMSAVVFQTGCTMLNANNNGQVPLGTKKIVETRWYEPIKQGDEWVCGVERWPRTIEYFDEYGNLVLEKYINIDGEVYWEKKWSYYDAAQCKLQKKEEHVAGIHTIEFYIRDAGGKLLRIEKEKYGKKSVEKFEYDDQGRQIKEVSGNKTTRIGYSPENSSTEITYKEVYDEECEYSYKGKYGLVGTTIIIKDKQTKVLLKQLEEFYEKGNLVEKKETECAYNSKGKCVFETRTDWLRGGKYFIASGISKADLALKKAGYFNWHFDEYGGDVEYAAGIFDEYGMPHTVLHYFYSRIYNENGDCIKCVKLEEKENIMEAESIEIRTITYL